MKNKILITGASGFIGYWLSKFLADDPNNQLYLIDSEIKNTGPQEIKDLVDSNSNIAYYKTDLSKPIKPQSLPQVDFIYHLAALNGTQNFYEQPYDVIYNSTLPIFNLIEYYKNSDLKRFVFASTSETYAGAIELGISPVPTPESTPLVIDDIKNPRWSYACSKINGESVLISANKQFKIPFNIIRYHNVYGPRMGIKHVIPDYLLRLKNNEGPILYGHMNTRSFLYVDNAVEDTIALAQGLNTENSIVNIGGDEEITMLSLAESINNILGIDEKIKLMEAPEGSVNRRKPDLELITKFLGKRSRISLQDGLRSTIKYYMNGKI